MTTVQGRPRAAPFSGDPALRSVLASLLLLAAPAAQADCSLGAVDRALGPGTHAALAAQTTGHLPIWIAEHDGRRLILAGLNFGSPDITRAATDNYLTLARNADRVILPFIIPTFSETRAIFAAEPELMFLQNGSLIDLLPPEDWASVDTLLRSDPGYLGGMGNALLQPEFIIQTAYSIACHAETLKLREPHRLQGTLLAENVPIVGLIDPLADLRFHSEIDITIRLRAMMVSLALIEDYSAVGVELSDLVLHGLPAAVALDAINAVEAIGLAALPPDDVADHAFLNETYTQMVLTEISTDLDRLGQACIPVSLVILEWYNLVEPGGILEQLVALGWNITEAAYAPGDNPSGLMTPTALPCTG